ncbi:P-loop containing nucleoside triphosphate hydrolase protein [Chiua virens]|nr:P-loop containing nucleoside triphosphate hydrolase protein [Chiua virens]
MYLRSAVFRIPSSTRSAATAAKPLLASRRILLSEVDKCGLEPVALRRTPHLTAQTKSGKCDLDSFTSNTRAPQPRSRPRHTSRPSLPQLDGTASYHPEPENEPSPSRMSSSKFKEHGSFRSGHTSASSTNKDSAAGIDRWHGKKASSRRFQPKRVEADLYIPSAVSVGQLAKLLNVRLRTLQRKMEQAGMHEESSYDYVLTSDYAALLVQELGRNPIINDEAAFDLYPPPPSDNPRLLLTRPPIVAIMGHVDHGKTTLLDNLRSSSVAASEAGGITQHVGAFCVPLSMSGHFSSTSEEDKRLITFLDTPGHAAFSAMRARGTSVTDIVVLVVAADDGVMPQTLEVIELVKREKESGSIGLVVAINKVDKPAADVEKTKLALLSAGVVLEEVGGDVPCVTVSGLTGSGLPELVETIALVADMMDLRAEQDCLPVGYVLESRLLKGFGPAATVLMTRGTLSSGTPLLAGTSLCSTRRLLSHSLQPITSAAPGSPVLVTGWKSLPTAGDEVLAGSEADVKKACANRERKRDLESALGDVEVINAARQADKEMEEREREAARNAKRGSRLRTHVTEDSFQEKVEKKYLRIVVKGDVSGSVEALVGAIKDIGNQWGV